MNIGHSPDSSESLSEATIYDILSNRRRRYAVHLLKRSDTVDVTELSRQITAWERDMPREEVSYADQKSVYTALRNTHLPLLADHDLIQYDEEANVVEATSGLSELEVYVEALGATEIPWGYYYLGIASISVLLFAAVVVGVPGLATVGPLGVSERVRTAGTTPRSPGVRGHQAARDPDTAGGSSQRWRVLEARLKCGSLGA